jgi:pre-mRNA-processing factor 6
MSGRGGPVAPGLKVDFNALKPPPGYVPGLGRGAAGFTTRSDIGPAMPAPDMPHDDEIPDAADDTKFDEFEGNDAGVFARGSVYDDEDKEADAIWEAIDKRMEERGKDRKEARVQEEEENDNAENPKISKQFQDLKRRLAELTDSDWEAIPEIGDHTIKKKKVEFYTPAPDSLLASAASGAENATTIDVTGGATTDLSAIGAGRSTVVQLNLDRLSDSVTGQTVVDPKGYLTDLKSVQLKSDAEISDIKKARLLLKSVINTNPKHAPGWIAAARLEEVAGKMQAARELAMKGCELCPGNEDIWIEAARLQGTRENAKAVLARGVAALPDSVALWLQAARLEVDEKAKKRVLLRALERIPQSVRLWKAAIELCDEDDARILLARAVECCPQHVELWLALARLETYDNAQKVLNKARQAIPTNAEVWLTAAKLQEAHGNVEGPKKIIPRGLKSLQANGVVLDREWWLREAENAERDAPPMIETCKAIVAAMIGHDVEDEDRLPTWIADADEAGKRKCPETARAILEHTLGIFPSRTDIWKQAADLEREFGSPASVDAVLLRAVQYCPQDKILWLMAAKEKWLAGDVSGARTILEEAFARNPDSEEIWLAATKVEWESGELARARAILKNARNNGEASTPRVWMKSAAIEREGGDLETERSLLVQGIGRFPDAWKLHIMLGQLEERLKRWDEARRVYQGGIRKCGDCVPLWIAAAKLEETIGREAQRGGVGVGGGGEGGLRKARALLEQARIKAPKNEELWLAAIRTELRGHNSKAADALLAKSLQECPNSGRLWAEAIKIAARPARKSKSVDALKKCNDDPYVVAAVACLFWQERKVDKARSWFIRATTLDSDIGDHWAMYYKFELEHGGAEGAEEVVRKCVAADPHHGERWQRVAKDVANAHNKVDVLLKKVAAVLD